jgi:hypothetical protein
MLPASQDLERRVRALGVDADAAPWVRRRVEAYLPTMLRRFGLDPVKLRKEAPLELIAAEARCAACADTGRCRRFLVSAADAESPNAFCPNAPVMHELARSSGDRAALFGRWPARLPKAPSLGLVLAAGGAVWGVAYLAFTLLFR